MALGNQLTGLQMPLTAWLSAKTPSSKSQPTTFSRTASMKRKSEQVQSQDTIEPPKKKGRYKENAAPSCSVASSSKISISPPPRRGALNSRGKGAKILTPSSKLNRSRVEIDLIVLHDDDGSKSDTCVPRAQVTEPMTSSQPATEMKETMRTPVPTTRPSLLDCPPPTPPPTGTRHYRTRRTAESGTQLLSSPLRGVRTPTHLPLLKDSYPSPVSLKKPTPSQMGYNTWDYDNSRRRSGPPSPPRNHAPPLPPSPGEYVYSSQEDEYSHLVGYGQASSPGFLETPMGYTASGEIVPSSQSQERELVAPVSIQRDSKTFDHDIDLGEVVPSSQSYEREESVMMSLANLPAASKSSMELDPNSSQRSWKSRSQTENVAVGEENDMPSSEGTGNTESEYLLKLRRQKEFMSALRSAPKVHTSDTLSQVSTMTQYATSVGSCTLDDDHLSTTADDVCEVSQSPLTPPHPSQTDADVSDNEASSVTQTSTSASQSQGRNESQKSTPFEYHITVPSLPSSPRKLPPARFRLKRMEALQAIAPAVTAEPDIVQPQEPQEPKPTLDEDKVEVEVENVDVDPIPGEEAPMASQEDSQDHAGQSFDSSSSDSSGSQYSYSFSGVKNLMEYMKSRELDD